ncbi:hypothetical protein CHU98_g3741 [Xylaria longipes]|nr:hypothetical protein CHU98_g3741 [Xylaria longipes]
MGSSDKLRRQKTDDFRTTVSRQLDSIPRRCYPDMGLREQASAMPSGPLGHSTRQAMVMRGPEAGKASEPPDRQAIDARAA